MLVTQGLVLKGKWKEYTVGISYRVQTLELILNCKFPCSLLFSKISILLTRHHHCYNDLIIVY